MSAQRMCIALVLIMSIVLLPIPAFARGGKLIDVFSVGSTSMTSTNSDDWVDVPDMSVTFSLSRRAQVLMLGYVMFEAGAAFGTGILGLRVMADGRTVQQEIKWMIDDRNDHDNPIPFMHTTILDPAPHTIKVQWHTANRGTLNSRNRIMNVLPEFALVFIH